MSNTYRGMPGCTKHHKNKFCAVKHTKDLQKYLLLALTATGRPNEIRILNPSAMTPTVREKIDDSGSHLPFILLKFSHWSHNTTRLTKASLERQIRNYTNTLLLQHQFVINFLMDLVTFPAKGTTELQKQPQLLKKGCSFKITIKVAWVRGRPLIPHVIVAF